MTGDFLRRVRIDQWTDAERAIQTATDEVEKLGADARLTEAVILLGQARDKVANVVDERLKEELKP